MAREMMTPIMNLEVRDSGFAAGGPMRRLQGIAALNLRFASILIRLTDTVQEDVPGFGPPTFLP